MIDYRYWIALLKQKGVGPAFLLNIKEKLDDLNLHITDIFDLTTEEIVTEFGYSQKQANYITSAAQTVEQIEETYYNLQDAGIQPMIFFEDDYPQQLKTKLGKDFPPLLYLLGNKNLLKKESIALLGDSEASNKGEKIAYASAKKLSQHNIVTISGMARGIDTIAHRSAIENNGYTIIVLPYGFFNLKVPEILKEVLIEDRVLFISQFPPQEPASIYHAYQRNALISALADAIFVVEATEKSGLLEVAKSAQSQQTPLYTTHYAEYSLENKGNQILLDQYQAIPVRGKKEGNEIVPNLDKLLAEIKF